MKFLGDIFVAEAAKRPDAIALDASFDPRDGAAGSSSPKRLTYSELTTLSGAVATALLQLVGPVCDETSDPPRIGSFLAPDWRVPVLVLALWRANLAYVPLAAADASIAQGGLRLGAALRKTRHSLVVVDSKLGEDAAAVARAALPGVVVRTVDELLAGSAGRTAALPTSASLPSRLCHIFHTSGSTVRAAPLFVSPSLSLSLSCSPRRSLPPPPHTGRAEGRAV